MLVGSPPACSSAHLEVVLVHLLADLPHLVHKHESRRDGHAAQDVHGSVYRPVDLAPVATLVEPGQLIIDRVSYQGNTSFTSSRADVYGAVALNGESGRFRSRMTVQMVV